MASLHEASARGRGYTSPPPVRGRRRGRPNVAPVSPLSGAHVRDDENLLAIEEIARDGRLQAQQAARVRLAQWNAREGAGHRLERHGPLPLGAPPGLGGAGVRAGVRDTVVVPARNRALAGTQCVPPMLRPWIGLLVLALCVAVIAAARIRLESGCLRLVLLWANALSAALYVAVFILWQLVGRFALLT